MSDTEPHQEREEEEHQQEADEQKEERLQGEEDKKEEKEGDGEGKKGKEKEEEEHKEKEKEEEEHSEVKEEKEEKEEEKEEEGKEKEGKEEEGAEPKYPYLLPQWQWSHHWQRRDRKRFLELCNRALARCEDHEGTLRPLEGDVKKLERGWQFIVDNLNEHAFIEEEQFFPALRQTIEDDEGLALLDHLLSDHKGLEERLHSIKDQKLEPLKGEGRTKEALQDFTDTVSDLLATYGEHINEEEEKVVPFVRRFMPAEAQKELGQSIKNHHKQLPSGKFGLIMFRDVIAEIPQEIPTYNSTFPWVLRKVVIPIMAMTDQHYKEYKAIFYAPWP